MITIDKTVKFDAAHLLGGDDGLCGNLHGHTYRVEVSITGETSVIARANATSMVMDFRQVKRILSERILARFDHAFIYDKTSATEKEIAAVVERLGMRVVALSFRSTVENLADYFYKELKPEIPGLSAVKVWETADNAAEYRESLQ